MKKKLLVLAISAAIGQSVMAQNAPPASTPTVKAVSVSMPIVPAPISSITPTPALQVPKLDVGVIADSPLVNPFSGKLSSDEEMQRELERKKRQTQMAEELLKQTQVANELHASTMRKNVEIAQSATSLQKEHNNQIDLRSVLETREAERMRITANYEAELKRQADEKRRIAAEEAAEKRRQAELERNKLSPTAAAEKRRAEAAAIKAAAELKESQARAISQVQPKLLPALESTMEMGGVKSAILSVNGTKLVVTDGDVTPYGKVRVLSSRSVSIDGRTVELSTQSQARFLRSDVQKEAPGPVVLPQPTLAPAQQLELKVATPQPETIPVRNEAKPVTLPRLQLPPPTFNR